MITVPTVLVLGAGASAPFGFPSGQLLVDLIIYYFLLRQQGLPTVDPDPWRAEIMKTMMSMLETRFAADKILSFAEHLVGEESVDAFLEHQTGDFLDIGKAAIAAVLLPFEREKDLDFHFIERRLESYFFETRQKAQASQRNWYQLLWRALNASFDKFEENALRIITFNYDRSLEHYLFTRLKRRYPGKKNEDYAAKMCEIIHIHGRLGRLPWQKEDNANDTALDVPYDAMNLQDDDPEAPSRSDCLDVARREITVIHEAKGTTNELKEARLWVAGWCRRLYFLGFGYHPVNLRRLHTQYLKPGRVDVRGTTYGLSRKGLQDITEIVSKMHMTFPEEALVPDTVYSFLHDHVNLEEP